MTNILQEFIKILPSFLWFFFVVIIFVVFYRPIRDELLPKLSCLEAGNIKLSFIKDSLDAAIKLAEKSPQWKIDIPREEKEKAIKRAKKNQELFRGTKFLWVDDFPENNLNERQMFQQLGAVIDLSKSTEDALKILNKADYDLVISDMARDDCPTAGLDFLVKLREKGNRTPLIFYLGVIDEKKGVPAGTFGLTNRPDELLHLTLDVLARRSS
ncbi:MAG: response regulator [bacterium]